MAELVTAVEGKEIVITNPDKVLWPEAGITKLDYIAYLLSVSEYMLPYTWDRMLMVWRYPDGANGRRIEERSIHGAAPDWVQRVLYNNKERILLNNAATLVWAANLGALEFHVPFDKHTKKDYPTELVFDLDPSAGTSFETVIETALKVKEALASLSLSGIPKTSGATGLQIYVPIRSDYTFEETRQVNKFIADYIVHQLPGKITLDRVVERRGDNLYLDYLQLWRGRTMAAPYSVRARPMATVSTPVEWEELQQGIHPANFTIRTVPDRIRRIGDLFQPVSGNAGEQELDRIIAFIKQHA